MIKNKTRSEKNVIRHKERIKMRQEETSRKEMIKEEKRERKERESVV